MRAVTPLLSLASNRALPVQEEPHSVNVPLFRRIHERSGPILFFGVIGSIAAIQYAPHEFGAPLLRRTA